MTNHVRDAILALIVLTSLFAAGSAFFDLGRRLPPPPDVRSTPVPQVAPDAQYH